MTGKECSQVQSSDTRLRQVSSPNGQKKEKKLTPAPATERKGTNFIASVRLASLRTELGIRGTSRVREIAIPSEVNVAAA